MAVAAALPHGLVIFRLAVTTAAALLAAAVDFVHGRPRATFCFALGNAAFLVALLDVALLTLFFVRVLALVPSRHEIPLPRSERNTRATPARLCCNRAQQRDDVGEEQPAAKQACSVRDDVRKYPRKPDRADRVEQHPGGDERDRAARVILP